MGESNVVKAGVIMDQVLNNIMEKYNRLLELYEEVYEKFKCADAGSVDTYLKIVDESSSLLNDISENQKKIEDLRKELNIHSDVLIDSILEGYSKGKIGQINLKIEEFINSIEVCKKKGIDALKIEDERVQNDLKDLGIHSNSFMKDISINEYK
jgi:hypothetical protein